MTELEKKMHDAMRNEIQWHIATESEDFEDMAKAAATIAIEEIKEAFNAGTKWQAAHQGFPNIEQYLKQKGYE